MFVRWFIATALISFVVCGRFVQRRVVVAMTVVVVAVAVAVAVAVLVGAGYSFAASLLQFLFERVEESF